MHTQRTHTRTYTSATDIIYFILPNTRAYTHARTHAPTHTDTHREEERQDVDEAEGLKWPARQKRPKERDVERKGMQKGSVCSSRPLTGFKGHYLLGDQAHAALLDQCLSNAGVYCCAHVCHTHNSSSNLTPSRRVLASNTSCSTLCACVRACVCARARACVRACECVWFCCCKSIH